MRQREKQIDPIELHALDFRSGCEPQHCVQIDRWFRIGPFADKAGPHGIVQCG